MNLEHHAMNRTHCIGSNPPLRQRADRQPNSLRLRIVEGMVWPPRIFAGILEIAPSSGNITDVSVLLISYLAIVTEESFNRLQRQAESAQGG
jgi:hypothetical protein